MSKDQFNRIRSVNLVYLFTVLFYLGMSMAISGLLRQADDILLQIVVSQVILVLPSVLYLFLTGTSLKDAIRLKKIKVTRILLLILFTFLITPLMSFLNSISLLFTTNRVAEEMAALSEYPLAVGMFVTAILPSVLEESVYRGIFYNEYRKVHIGKGILLSGLLFGLMHLNLNQFSYAFAMGCIFALVIEITDSIFSTMMIHFVFNASSTISVYLTSLSGVEETLDFGRTDISLVLELGMAAVVPTILAALVLVLLSRLEGRSEVFRNLFTGKEAYDAEKNGEKGKKELVTIPLIMGILICIGYMVLAEIVI